MKRILLAFWAVLLWTGLAYAQTGPLQTILQENRDLIEKSSRQTIQPAINAIADSGVPGAADLLVTWEARQMYLRDSDGLFFRGVEEADRNTRLFDLDTGEDMGVYERGAVDQIRPNSGVQGLINAALVRFRLSDPDPKARIAALQSLERRPDAESLELLRDSIPGDPDPAIKARKERLERLLTITYDPDESARIAAIEEMSSEVAVDVRAALNPLVATQTRVFEGAVPADLNVARMLEPGSDALSREAAYEMLVAAGNAPARITPADVKAALGEHVDGGLVGGVPVHSLITDEARYGAYAALVRGGLVPPFLTDDDVERTLAAYTFAEIYSDPSPAITDAAGDALEKIELKVGLYTFVDLVLDALSLTSIYFLAAIGLAVTFGVMGVINMAHGEFIMMGAYTGYVIQQIIPDHTISILVALPVAFVVTFLAGVLLERLVIRWLYDRPLETLLATFGVSIALQQLAKNIFGTQARPLTAPAWLDGAVTFNDVVSISSIRVAIFVLAAIFFALVLLVMKRTRLGLETRAVTQNPRMAASMGIDPNRVNMLTFGLGSGIAGVAGVAIGLFAQVTSELGQAYIVQSFMTVVVGGVGNIWGTLAGAAMIGSLQKGIEFFNPANTLAAQTYMIVFIIIFIQFRPRGIIALRGRAAGD
ncbi:urea ABC transporter permease subunit UrtB [Chachezhania sediminis]|uniref:urea ABC transporter permease subunit UrtB n=1 Tax=Chachezhania sediminis TaxID=2599291 RepID=UPI00131D19B7|nr:urea ABC transporter permease subunit UrtB [Chachezhania sediminis]